MVYSKKNINYRTHTSTLFLDLDHSLGIHVTFIIPKCYCMNWINVEEARTLRFLVHCIILLIIVVSIILFQSILVILFPSFQRKYTRILYALGITIGLKSIFGNFIF